MPRRIALLAALAALAMLLALPGSPGARDRDRQDRDDRMEEAAETTVDDGATDDAGKDEGRAKDEATGDLGVPDRILEEQQVKEPGGGDDRGPRGRNDEDRDGEVIPDQYIVVYEPSVDAQEAKQETAEIEEEEDVDADHSYSRAMRGFSAEMSEEQAEAIEQDPEVAAVVPDRVVEATGSVALVSGEFSPTGVRRFGAGSLATAREASTTNVAVIDTGIDLDHPDLNVSAGKNCSGSGPPDDGDGHGTHVAGTIGARNNGSGVVGVAPGTKVYAVKVLGDDGEGSWSDVICGIEWVTANRSANNIGVANMSLGGVGSTVDTSATSCAQMSTDALRRAICNSTAAGVTYVVAAGNSDYDFDYLYEPDTPAAYPEVLTVTAMSDANGAGGGTGGSPSCDSDESDDRHASFSNFALTAAAKAHTIAAPGVCILSTVPGGHATYSGTSMATPHVTGAVALCFGEGGQGGPCSGLTPAQIISRMRSTAQDQRSANSTFGFEGDPSSPVGSPPEYFGYLAFAGPAGPDNTRPSVTSVYPPAGTSGVSTATGVAVTFSEAMDKSSAQNAFSLTRSAGGTVSGSFAWSGNTMVFQPSAALSAGMTHTARVNSGAKDTAGNSMSGDVAWNFTTASPTVNCNQITNKKKRRKCLRASGN